VTERVAAPEPDGTDEAAETPQLAESPAEAEAQPESEVPAEAAEQAAEEEFSADELLPDDDNVVEMPVADAQLKAVLEAIIYVTDEPLTLEQICTAIEQPRDRVIDLLEQLAADYEQPHRGLSIREIAGGFKMTTKPEHHDAVRRFVKNLNPPMKLSLPALETLAVIAYKQPITGPEIMEIRGVQGAGVLKTLVDRRLIATAGRKQVVGKPILYKTTREFLLQFGLRDLAELPTLKEFQELARFESEPAAEAPAPQEPNLFTQAPAESPAAPAAPEAEAATEPTATEASAEHTPEPEVAEAKPEAPAEPEQ